MKYVIYTLLLLGFSTSVFAQKNGAKEGIIDASNLTNLRMNIDAGMDINIIGNLASNEIKYEYTFEGNAEAYAQFFENFEPKFETRGGEAQFLVEFPKQSGRKVNHVVKKHSLIFTVPENLFIELSSRYSNIDIKNLNTGLVVQNRSGSILVENIKQAVMISNEYGDVNASNIVGELMISNRSAKVDIKEVTGKVIVKADYSKLNISKIDGDLEISNRSGIVNAFDVRGSLMADGPYVEYELTNIDGDIRMNNKSGKLSLNSARSLTATGDYTPITASNIRSENGVDINGRSAAIALDNIEGKVMISGLYLTINLKKIVGPTRIENRSANVTLTDIEHDVEIYGEYLPIQLTNYKGNNISVINKSEDINIETVNRLINLYIENEYGDVNITMKTKFQGDVTIETSYGELDSNLDLNSQQLTTSENIKVMTGNVGNSLGNMLIKTKSSKVTINQ